jgi:glycerophosphoryl diester phosphodiesterase
MSKLLRTWGLRALVVLAAALLVLFLTAQPAAQPLFLEKHNGRPLVIAHKGGDGLAPGNTLEAFACGLQEGADILETDARLTADGHVVLFHDATVEDTTEGTGRVEEMTLAELKKLNVAHHWTPPGKTVTGSREEALRAPTLEEALTAFPEARFNIDMKTHSEEMALELYQVVDRTNAVDRVLVTSFDDATVQSFRELLPSAASSLASNEVRLFFGLQLLHLEHLYTPPAAAAQVPEYEGSLHVVTPRFIRAAHSRGLQVHVWTINDRATMKRLLAMGVDGIVTDYPNVLRKLVSE